MRARLNRPGWGIVFGITWGLAGLVFSSPEARAFPENVRHGYPNCVSCHINPSGTGQLNDYGRQLSKAVQSYGKFFFEPTAKFADTAAAASAESDRDPETEFLYGYFPRPSWLQLGGDIRLLQLFMRTQSFEEARFIVMQADLEAAVTLGRLTLDATIGRVSPENYGIRDPGALDYVYSRRHYLLFQATDEIHVMAGRFWRPHGILDPNHTSAVKQGLGWNFGSEPYLLQAGYTGGSLSVVAYGDFGRYGNGAPSESEQGGGATASLAFADTYKAGVSYYYGSTSSSERHVFGPWGILGFTEHVYLRTENDFIRTAATGSSPASAGFATYNRLGYELIQGVHAFGEQGYLQSNFDQDSTRQQQYGVGMLYYPRTHWEFELDYQKRKLGATAPFGDYVYLQLHYYL